MRALLFSFVVSFAREAHYPLLFGTLPAIVLTIVKYPSLRGIARRYRHCEVSSFYYSRRGAYKEK
jgi:hypothetical protein